MLTKFMHEYQTLLVCGELEFSQKKLLKAMKMLKLECKHIYFCYIVNISKLDPRMDPIVVGSSSIPTLVISDKIRAQFLNDFKIELLFGLPPHMNVEHKIKLVYQEQIQSHDLLTA